MQEKKVTGNKPTMLETHLDKSMIHTPKLTTLDGEITLILGGETNKTKAKIRDATITIPTTMQLSNIPHRDPIITHLITLLNHLISTHHHQPRIDFPKLRLYLKTYAKKSKTTECSRMKCEPISKTKEKTSRDWSPK